jgi:hypothetical protein
MSHDKDEALNVDVIQMLLMGIQLPRGLTKAAQSSAVESPDLVDPRGGAVADP